MVDRLNGLLFYYTLWQTLRCGSKAKGKHYKLLLSFIRSHRRLTVTPILFIHYLFLSVWFCFVLLSMNVDRFKLIQKLQIGSGCYTILCCWAVTTEFRVSLAAVTAAAAQSLTRNEWNHRKLLLFLFTIIVLHSNTHTYSNTVKSKRKGKTFVRCSNKSDFLIFGSIYCIDRACECVCVCASNKKKYIRTTAH